MYNMPGTVLGAIQNNKQCRHRFFLGRDYSLARKAKKLLVPLVPIGPLKTLKMPNKFLKNISNTILNEDDHKLRSVQKPKSE